MNFEEKLNNVIDDDSEMYLGEESKKTALLIEQGTKKALNEVVLSKDLDTIDVAKQSKGSVSTLTFAAAGDSAEINCVGFKAILLEVVGSATISVKGTMISGGTKYACFNGTTQMTSAITTGGCLYFVGVPDYISINASAACTVYVQPLN